MPVTKRFEINRYLEDFEEIDEHSPFFNPSFLEEEEILPEEETTLNIPFWKKWWTIINSFFSR